MPTQAPTQPTTAAPTTTQPTKFPTTKSPTFPGQTSKHTNTVSSTTDTTPSNVSATSKAPTTMHPTTSAPSRVSESTNLPLDESPNTSLTAVTDDIKSDSDSMRSDPVNLSNFIVPSAVGIVVIAICVLIICCIKRRKDKKAFIMKHPMVVLIGIGKYDRNDIDNLPVDIDLKSLTQLFAKENLNYTVFQEYEDENHKMRWTQSKLKDYLKQQAQYLKYNMDKFDGLTVVSSSHGQKDYVITSDGKLFNKAAVHRIFSAYLEIREMPRLFLYDCCDGSNAYGKGAQTGSDGTEMTALNTSSYGKGKETDTVKDYEQDTTQLTSTYPSNYIVINQEDDEEKEMRISKNFEVKDVKSFMNLDIPWPKDSHNPDHRLAQIHAANDGFESAMHKEKGSYLLRFFVERVMGDINRKKSRFIYQIFDEIEDTLKSRQLPKTNYYNGTRYIKLEPNLH